MSASPLLRSVMDETEYDRERKRIAELYGEPDDKDDVAVAKRDRAFADLFYRSGWTQEQLAEREGKSRIWVVCRLRFARFLAYKENVTAVTLVPVPFLTEWCFRSYWERTQKTDDEPARFAEVIRLMQQSELVKNSHPQATSNSKPDIEDDSTTNAQSRDVGNRMRGNAEKLAKARKIVRPLVEDNKKIRAKKLAAEHGIGNNTFERAIDSEIARKEAIEEAAYQAPIDPSILGEPLQKKFERLQKQLDSQFEYRVQAEVTRRINEDLMPFYKEKLDKADQLSKYGKPFTRSEYRLIAAALHPDNQNEELRRKAWDLFTSKEVVLRPEEKDHSFASDLPTTIDELLARRTKTQGRHYDTTSAPDLD